MNNERLLANGEIHRDKGANRRGAGAIFHYVPLHLSPAGAGGHDGRALPVTEVSHARLLRLPLYPSLDAAAAERVVDHVFAFFGEKP